MEIKTKIEKIVIGLCLGILCFMSLTIATRFFTRQVLIKRLEMDNTLTRMIWFDNLAGGGFVNNANGDTLSSYVDINWAERYPFDETQHNIDIPAIETDEKESNVGLYANVSRITDIVSSIENVINIYATNNLMFRQKIVEAASVYEKKLGWNFTSFQEYNGVVELSDGYLTGYTEKKDTSQQHDALAELNDYCHINGMDFLYVQAPGKISEYDDKEVSGILDFSNQNANELLAKLESSNIDCYDIRETIRSNNLHNHDLFYKTDHHWLTTTGLWASQNILDYCNKKYDWNAELSLLDENQFEYVTYKKWFLGSQGRKVTLSRCVPDDFTLLYPKYNTKFYYHVPAKDIETIDDYSVIYNMSSIETCNYYSLDPYSGCNYGDQPLIQIENQLPADDHKILMIHDSFGDCVISCLALAEKNVDSLDLRHFTGSVKRYIQESKPDVVIVMYNTGFVGGDINYSTHEDIWDFR